MFVALFFVQGLSSCSDESSPGESAPVDDAGLRDRGVGSGEDAGSDSGENDTGQSSDTGVTIADIADGGSGSDPSSDPGEGPGPSNPSLECVSHSQCPAAGDDPGVCCSAPLRYESVCSTLSACGPGGRDACVNDSQCPSRTNESGEPRGWTVCCHDRGAGVSLNYCAGSEEVCQPVVPCEIPSDCATAPESMTCCSYHDFYQRSTCTTAFFALNASDCL